MEDFDLIIMEAGPASLFSSPGFLGRSVTGQAGKFSQNKEIREEDGSFYEGYFEKSGMAAFVALKVFNPGTVVHEFGHVTGLRHEHIRDEAKQDANCAKPNVKLDTGELLYDTAELVTPYDARSIMNYCYLKTHKGQFKNQLGSILSDDDRLTLKNYY